MPTHLCAHIPYTCIHRPAPVETPCTQARVTCVHTHDTCTCPHTCVHTSPSHAYTGLHLRKCHVHIHDTCAHAHTPVCAYTLHTHTHAYACRNSVYISTHMTHTYTGWHRSPGSCWQGHLLVTPPWGGGGNLTGRVPSSGRSPGPHTGLAALPALHHLALPRVLGRARKQSHRSLPSPPTARPCSQRGATGLPSPPGATTARPAQATCPEAPSPCQSSLRSGRAPALSPPGSPGGGAGLPGAAGGRREAAPRSGAAGLCLCAHFGNCRFSSLANYLLGGGLKTVHTHKSPRDLNKRRWQVIFQHSPTLMRRERGRVGPRVGCGENELR